MSSVYRPFGEILGSQGDVWDAQSHSAILQVLLMVGFHAKKKKKKRMAYENPRT